MKPHVPLTLLVAALAALSCPAQEEAMAKARQALDEEQPARAMAILKEQLDAVKKNPEALALLARSALQAGMYGEAVTWSGMAFKLAPNDADVSLLAGKAFYFRAQQKMNEPGATGGGVSALFEEAVSFLDNVLEETPENAEALEYKGHALYYLGRQEESGSTFEKGAGIKPGERKWPLFAARSYRAGEQYDKAVKVVEKAIDRHGDDALLYAELGDVYGTMKPPELEKAGQAYARALRCDELSDETATQMAGNLWGIWGAQGETAKALEAVNGWVEAHPRSKLALWWKGFYHMQAKEFDEAARAYQKAYEVSGNSMASALAGAAEAHWWAGRHEQACKLMLEAARLPWTWNNPQQSPLYKLRSFASQRFSEFSDSGDSGKLREAIDILESYAVKAAPSDYEVLQDLGFFYRELSTSEGLSKSRRREISKQSIKWYEKAVKAILESDAEPSMKAKILNDTGILYHFDAHQIGKIEKAIEYYRRALKFDPEYVDALENLGLCMNRVGDYEKAVPLFEKVLEAQPRRMVSRRGLDEARKALER